MLAPVFAFAADLGRLTVLSGVGEPLRAEIEILSVQASEATSLAARIPPADVFWRANLEPPPFIDHLRARVERRPRDRYVVTLSSTKPVESPFIQILVELDSVAGRVVREYPFLLQELGVTPASPALPIATAPNVSQSGPPESAVYNTYTVRPGDTLAGIARATRPRDATVEQTMVALYRANVPAFIDGNMNQLFAGAVLALPPDAASRAIEPAEARRMILVQLAAVPRSTGETGARTVTGAGTASVKPDESPVLSRPRSGDHLRLARPRESGSDGGSSNSAGGDDIVALQRALAEAEKRIALLQRDLEDVRRLLALKGEQLLRSVDQPEHGFRELPNRIPGNAAAAERNSERESGSGTSREFVREHSALLLATFLVGFALWVVMPVKTARAWLKRRQRQDRATIHARLDLPRTRPLRRLSS
jgi:pilus assembly protein FimV